MRTEVANTGTKTLPMGYGIHPWFPTTLRPGAKLPAALGAITPEERAAAEVRVPAAALWELEHLMPTGRVVPVSDNAEMFDLRAYRPLNRRFYDHVFTGVEYRADGWSEGGLRDPATGLEMYLAADGKFREWVLYAPEKSPVIALEPYTCTTDAVNLEAQGFDAGLIALPAGETWTGDIHFGLRRFV
jgi:aldose 1-epimerase